MIALHATKKLAAKLPLTEQGRLPEPKRGLPAHNAVANNPLSGWHGNLLTIQRRNCVLLVHDATRFALFIANLKKADLAELDYHFTDSLMNTLLKAGANKAMLALLGDHQGING